MTIAPPSPKFSIITASYNYGHYIGECLQSVAAQTDVSFEHLIMDAGSNDHTADVVKSFPHAQFFQEPDKGMSDGINKGFRKAKGEWVMWLNADDKLKPGALKAVSDFVNDHATADVVFGGWEFVDASGDFIRSIVPIPFDRNILIQHGCYIGSTSCFYKRSTTIDEGHLLNDDFGYCMDGEYYARLSGLGKKFIRMPQILAEFRLHSESISQQNLGKSDMASVLRFQRQSAEPRTIRRVYGIKWFRDESLNLIMDGIFHHVFRLKKGIVKIFNKNVV
jgi:glycosyltransferase involved in cell wall biosynthesis